MTRRVCNRCGQNYDSINGGELELTGTDPRVSAQLCHSCYGDMVSEYREGDDA